MMKPYRIYILALAAIICAVSGIVQAEADVPVLFSEAKGSDLIEKPQDNPYILRQRPIVINTEIRDKGLEHLSRIRLPFFEDADFVAVMSGFETGALGMRLWMGEIKGQPGSEVTLAVSEDSMAGTLQDEAMLFQIRTDAEDRLIVREIDTALLKPLPTRQRRITQLPLESQVVELVNQERDIEGLYPYQYDAQLNTAARLHSEDMAENNYFKHISLDGRTFSQRINETGYPFGGVGAENIGAGSSTAQLVMEQWMNSDQGHRESILGGFCDIGVGYAYDAASTWKHYWTQDFATKTGVTTCPTLLPTYGVSGYVRDLKGGGISNALISFSNNGGSAMTGAGGYYAHGVTEGWSGDLTPSHNSFEFAPENITLSNVTSDQSNQNFTGTAYDLESVIIILQVLTDANTGEDYIGPDLNDDDVLEMSEAIFLLQKVSGLR